MATSRELLRAAMLRADILADHYVTNAAAADRSWRAMRTAMLLIDRGSVATARKVLQKALAREDRRGARR
jgi:hypothetical protein